MAATPPGADHDSALIPGQIVYRRFASETRTVEVTSTAPWTTQDPRAYPEKKTPTLPNTKEQADATLKWTSKQPCLQEATRNLEENQTTSHKEESSATQNKNMSHSDPNRDKPHKADTAFGEDGPHFGGRGLSLNARDKVVGGAAIIFTDPLYCSLDGERRKSEYDVGRLPSVAFGRPESRRITEPTIEEHKIQSTLRVAADTESALKPEAKRSSYPGLNNNAPKISVDSPQSTSNKNVLSTFKPVTKIALENTAVTSSKHISDSQCGKVHFQKKTEGITCNNAKSSRPGNDKETKIEENTLQTSLNRSGNLATKNALQSDVTLEGSCLYSAKSNINENGHMQSNGKTNGSDTNSSLSHTENVKFREPKTKDKENRISSSAPGRHPASGNLTLKNPPDLTVQEGALFLQTPNAPNNEAKLDADILCKPSDMNKDSSFSRSKNTNSALFLSENTSDAHPRSEHPNSSFPRTENSSSSFSGTVNTNSSLSRSENPSSSFPRIENKNSSSPRSKNTKSSFERAGDARASVPEMEGSKIQTAGSSNTSTLNQPTEKTTPRTQQTETISHPTLKISSDKHLKTEKEETTSTRAASQDHQRKYEITLQKYPESGSQDLSSENKTRDKENQASKTEHNVSAMKTQKNKSVCYLTNATIENRPRNVSHGESLDAVDLNQSNSSFSPTPELGIPKLKNSLITSNNRSKMSSSKEPTKSPSMMKTQRLEKTDSRDANEKVLPKTPADSKTHSVITYAAKSSASSKENVTVSSTVQSKPSTAERSTVSSQSAAKDQRLADPKVKTGELGRSRSVCCSSKQEPRLSSREPFASRSVTRSKSDVGVGNKGRTATPARKSCAGRRCCGAQSGLLQEAATVAGARSLSRGQPMGSTASLAPKNKSSWTTQRALESEVQQLKRELQMHKSEELRLHREIHKLRSVLQQATSFGEEAMVPGDPDDGALLTSLQDRHGMAGAAGAPMGASKKQGVSGESCEPESMEVPRHEKDMRSRQLIKAAILDNDFLKNLARSQIRELVDCMYLQKVHAGSYVIREGEAGSHLYVLDDGEMEVLKEGTVLGRMGPGKAFGELAILYNCTRTASIRAVSDLQVWVLERRAFQQIMMRTGIQRLEDNIAFLRSVPLLRGINDQTLARIADALEPEFYSTDEYIVRQGARGNTFFIISGGSVEVTQRGTNGYEVVLRTLGRGEYFGEQALLHDDCRTASVRALPPGVDCLTLDREFFNALIGSLSELHHKDYAEDTKSLSSRTSFNNDYRKEDEAVSTLHLDDLRPLGTLGVGGFGCVRLVMAPNGRSYALKCLSKRHVAATGQQEHVAAERDVLLAARSPFIVRLFRTFRDEANVYLLLEACLGGEVWALLREHERLPDKAARFVTACVLEALDYLHARDIIYRDLKPENLVMDAEGYVKLVDFGFCKRVPGGCKTWTFCGTPEYVAPEVILNRGHDRAVDYWALGVLIYELLTGAPPFAATDPMGTYNLILLGMESAIMPKYMSRTATHLIRRLCGATPSERLGYQRGSFREVKAHRWFQDFDWDALRTHSMIPPIKPEVRFAFKPAATLPAQLVPNPIYYSQVSGPTDMSNFYPQTLDEELVPAELSQWDADF